MLSEQQIAEDFELSSEELANLPHNHRCFNKYSPRDILKNSQKKLKVSFSETNYLNPHTKNSNERVIYEVIVKDIASNRDIIKEKTYATNKMDGRYRTFLKVLSSQLLFGPHQMWNDLVEKTEALVNRQRAERNAMEKPVYKKREDYMREFQMEKEQKEQQAALVQ